MKSILTVRCLEKNDNCVFFELFDRLKQLTLVTGGSMDEDGVFKFALRNSSKRVRDAAEKAVMEFSRERFQVHFEVA